MISLVLGAFAACSGGHAGGDAAIADDMQDPDGAVDAVDAAPPVVRPLGTVSGVTYSATCASASTPVGSGGAGFRCASMTVSCPGVDPIAVEVALAPTTQATSKGAIVTHNGATGQAFLANLAGPLRNRGWDLAQIAWVQPWECPKLTGNTCALDTTPVATRLGPLEGACRVATVIAWIHDSAQRANGTPFRAATAPLCGEGFSGGTGALWFALAHYGMASKLDYVLTAASTPFSRFDVGCDPANAAMTVAAPCENVTTPPQVPLNYNSNGANSDMLVNRLFSTQSCDNNPTAAELAMFARESVLSPGADLGFRTHVAMYNCVDAATVNVVPGLGRAMYDAVKAVDPTKVSARCVVTGAGGNGTCTGEAVFADPTMAMTAVNDLDTGCVKLP